MILIETIIEKLKEGKCVVVHCNGGKGRSGTVLVATLVALGKKVQQAIEIVRKARSGTIQNPLQIAYVKNFKTSWRKNKKQMLKEQEKRTQKTGTHDDDRDPDDETFSPEEIAALKSFQNKANDQEEKVVIYTHRPKITTDEIQDPTNSPSLQNGSYSLNSSQPKKEPSKGLWFMKGGGNPKAENQKKITRQQKKEAKKRQAFEKQRTKISTNKKPNISQQNPYQMKGVPSDYDGIEAIEPIEIPFDDDYSSDEEEQRTNPVEKKTDADESIDIADETDEETVE